MDTRHQFKVGPFLHWKGLAGALWAEGLWNSDVEALIHADLLSFNSLKTSSIETLKEAGVSDRGIRIIRSEYQIEPGSQDALRMLLTVVSPLLAAALLGLWIYAVKSSMPWTMGSYTLSISVMFWISVAGVAAFGWIPLVIAKPYQYRICVPMWILTGPMIYAVVFHPLFH